MKRKILDRWDALLRQYEIAPAEAQKIYHEIHAAYTGADRHYHNTQHIEHVFEEMEAAECQDEACSWAAIFHDLVYDPYGVDNEKKSAELADKYMGIIGVNDSVRRRAVAMIIATEFHAIAKDNSEAIFLDADMAILGASSEKYREYFQAIALEYKRLPQQIYANERKKLILAWLSKDRIFQTDLFRAKYEKRARANLMEELDSYNGSENQP